MANLTHTITITRSDTDREVGTTVVLSAAAEYQGGRRTIGITEEYVDIDPDIAHAGLLYVRNLDASNPIKFGYATGDYPNRVYPNEQGSLPLAPDLTRISFIADTFACDMTYEITSRSDLLTLIASPSARPSASASPSPTPSSSPSSSSS
jgi:hypothetical protein